MYGQHLSIAIIISLHVWHIQWLSEHRNEHFPNLICKRHSRFLNEINWNYELMLVTSLCCKRLFNGMVAFNASANWLAKMTKTRREMRTIYRIHVQHYATRTLKYPRTTFFGRNAWYVVTFLCSSIHISCAHITILYCRSSYFHHQTSLSVTNREQLYIYFDIVYYIVSNNYNCRVLGFFKM